MPDAEAGLCKVGGAAFVAAGTLFLARDVLDLIAGPPPATGAAILTWVAVNKVVLSFVSEATFFATMALVPAVFALYRSLSEVDRTKAAVGTGTIAVVIPVLAMPLIVHGRLVYPVFGLRVDTPAVAELVVALYFGGLHAVWLLLSGATVVLSLVMWRHAAYGGVVAALGFASSALDIAASYPDAIGPAMTFGCEVVFSAWITAVGVKLYGRTRV